MNSIKSISKLRSDEITSKVFSLRHKSDLRICALGDSSVFGVGDLNNGVPSEGPGWVGRLAHDLKASKYINFAYNGARVKDVMAKQLPGALAMKPDLTLICMGTNDVLRNNFSIPSMRSSLSQLTGALNAAGSVVLFLGLPDPIKSAPGPMSLKKILHRRISWVNDILAQVAAEHDCLYLSIWQSDEVYHRAYWHVDRMHPSAKGYQWLADQVRRYLFLPRRARHKLSVTGIDNRRFEIIWLLTNGSKWFLKRSIDLLPALLWLYLTDRFSKPPLPSKSSGAISSTD